MGYRYKHQGFGLQRGEGVDGVGKGVQPGFQQVGWGGVPGDQNQGLADIGFQGKEIAREGAADDMWRPVARLQDSHVTLPLLTGARP